MPLNSYFLQGSKGEQRLVQDLINEQLKIYGQDIVYLPRKMISQDAILNEAIATEFDDSFRMEAYLANYEGFAGNGDILSKFGVQSTDQITLIVSKERYEDFISPFLDGEDVLVSSRPQEGDLIYLPLDNTIFEIKYVEAKKPFYQLNKLFVYQLSCEVFDAALDELVDTGIEEVDQAVSDFIFTTKLTMVALNSQQATVTVQLAKDTGGGLGDFAVNSVDLINDGTGYTVPPNIDFEPAPSGGITPTAIAIMTQRTGQVGQSIESIQITNPGIGYTRPPKITIRPANAFGAGAAATAIITEGALGPGNVTFAGVGYGVTPTVSIERPDPAATATATVGASGTITALNLTFGGFGYVTAPPVTISAPNRSGSISSFRLNNAGIKTGDVYTQGTSGLNSSGVGGFAGSHGQDYVVGDIVTFVKSSGVGTAGTEARIRIDSINVDGAVTGFTQIYGGYDYEISEGSSAGLYEAENVSGSMNGNGLRLRIELIESVVGTTATGIASITSGIVTSLTITNPGGGYTKSPHANAPTVTISNDDSIKDQTVQRATAVAILSVNDTLSGIRYTNAGAGYTAAPPVVIESPASGINTDNYLYGELVRGVSTGTTAYVHNWDADTNVLQVTNASSNFAIGELVVGVGTANLGSDASRKISTISDQDEFDEFADNIEIETEADTILDFTERNPFGEI